MEPSYQFNNVVSLIAKKEEKNEKLRKERQWGPQQANIVRPYDPEKK
jgi:hypothetical protein